MSFFRSLFSSAADMIYPRHCPSCGNVSDRPHRHVCWDCFSSIEWYQEGLCEQCGGFFGGKIKHRYICSRCASGMNHFDRARAASRYDGNMKKIIAAFKYKGGVWLTEDLTDVLEGCVRAHFDVARIDAVLPVPLYHARERERKYNQSAFLAMALAKRIGRRYDAAALFRSVNTRTQTRFDARGRRLNVGNSFVVRKPEMIFHRRILLVDDVMTTGATFDSCARALKRAGASEVWAIACARSDIEKK